MLTAARPAGLALPIVTASAAALVVAANGNGSALASSTPHWRVVHRNHRSAGNAFTGVLAFSPHHAWAMGLKDTASNGAVGFLMRWNGTNWRSKRLPVSNFRPASMAASGRLNVWLFGEAVKGGIGTTPEVLRWNGRWHIMKLPYGPGLASPVVLGPSQVWVPGDTSPSGGYSRIWRWNGTRWTLHTVRAVVGGEAGSISGSSLHNLWAVGVRHRPRSIVKAYRWGSGAWHRVRIPAIHGPGAVAARTRHDVWIEGWAKRRNGTYHRVILHWNGSHWRWIRAPWYASAPPVPDGHGGVWAGKAAHWAHGSWTLLYPDPPRCVASGYNFLAAVAKTHSIWDVSACQRTSTSLTQGIISVSGPLP